MSEIDLSLVTKELLPLLKNPYRWGGPELSRLDVYFFLRKRVDAFVDAYRKTHGENPDPDTIREGVIDSEAFSSFIESRYFEIIPLFSDDYLLMLGVLFAHRGKELPETSNEKIVANYDYFRKQLLKKGNKKELAREMLISNGDFGNVWNIPIPCLSPKYISFPAAVA